MITLAEAALLAGVHRNTVRAWCDSGRLPSVRVSRRGDRRLHRRDLDQFLEGRNGSRREPGSQTTAASAPPPTTSREPKPSTDVSTHQSELPALLDEVLELHASLGGMTARLKAIQDLAVRLNRIQDVRGIAEAIVAEVHNLIEYDSIRVYQVDHVAGMCEPLAFRGQFLGTDAPDPSLLRLPIGRGLTGWVAEHGETLVVADAAADPRGVTVRTIDGPESMLLVPMSYEDTVRGVIVLSKGGRGQFDEIDRTTISIFAGHAAQAIVNAENAGRLQLQQAELEHQLASQRRLLDVNERLLSTLDPAGVLEMIADSLKVVLSYNSLTIYRVDRERSVRSAVLARDEYAEAILSHEAPLNVGLTGWAIEHREAAVVEDADNDPRCVHIPGTPHEWETLIVVPLIVDGDVIGTLNVSRLGEGERPFNENEFELTKLFAGQASLALRNAEAHRAVETRADRDSLTGLRNHGAFQRDLDEVIKQDLVGGRTARFALLMMDLDFFKQFNDRFGHPAGDALLRAVGNAISSATRGDDRPYRYGGDEFAVILPGASRTAAHDVADRIRRIVNGLSASEDEPRVTISIGSACYPDDARAKDDLVAAADTALYLSKPSHADDQGGDRSRDAYLAALNETALTLMDHLEPSELLHTIIARAAALMGTTHGFIYLTEADGSALVIRLGIGLFEKRVGTRAKRGEGLAGHVWQSGRPVVDTDSTEAHEVGCLVGVPLMSAGAVAGVIGLASGDQTRIFGQAETAVLSRFAQLASIALDNARLLQAAQTEVGERSRAESALRESEERFRRLADAAAEPLAIHREGTILEVNKAFGHLFGKDPATLVGRSLIELAAPEAREHLLEHSRTNPDEPIETLALGPNGMPFPVEILARTIPYGDGEPARVISVRDLRERRELEERLAHQSLYDGLSGLPNRTLLLDRIGHALSSVRPNEPAGLALILLDLDRFKVVNESLGRSAGDELLVDVGRRLERCVRPGDTVARFGGDEFAVLLDEVHDVEEARAVARRIEAEMRSPFDIGSRPTLITASMGIVIGRAGESNPDELLRDAEIALYRAKGDATARHAVFEPAMSTQTLQRLEMESDLRWAVERDELRLHYQPLVDLRSGRIVAVEALLRWQHPVHGLVPPLAFIPLAEETGLIVPIGQWVLETACRQARAWQLAHPHKDPVRISVNLSARQFAQPDLVGEVALTLAETGLPPGTLELEITESVLMDDAAVGALRNLRELGVHLALDDFGTGFSSLSYLKHLPLDTIKVDRAFVSGLGEDAADGPIVQAVVGLAHGLGIRVTAEGIETVEQLGWLRRLSCDRGQGFYFARPRPAEEIGELLESILSLD